MCVCEYIYVYILPSPASCPSPTDPALRASPYPEIPYLLCFNMSAAAHLGDLLGVRGSAARNLPPLPGEPQFSKAQAPLFRQTHSRVLGKERELREPPPTPPTPSAPGGPSRPLRIGDLNPADSLLIGRGQWRQSPIPSERRLPVSQDWPVFNCCSHGTLRLFSLQSSRLNSCCCHQHLHLWWLQPGSHPGLQGSLQGPCSSLRVASSGIAAGDVCVGGGGGGSGSQTSCSCVCIYIYVYVYTHTHTHTHIYIYTHTVEYKFRHQKEWNNAICSNMDGPRYHHSKRSQKQIPYDITYMWNRKYDTDQYIYGKKKTDSQTENRLVVVKKEDEWGRGWLGV